LIGFPAFLVQSLGQKYYFWIKKAGYFAITIKPETLESQSKAQETRITA